MLVERVFFLILQFWLQVNCCADCKLLSSKNDPVIVIVIVLCLQYVLKWYPRKFLELLAGTPPHLTINQVSYHSAESTEMIAWIQ